MSIDKPFKVLAYDGSNAKRAELLEAVINSPGFIKKVVQATEMFAERFIIPEMLEARLFSEAEKAAGIEMIIKEVSE